MNFIISFSFYFIASLAWTTLMTANDVPFNASNLFLYMFGAVLFIVGGMAMMDD